VGFRRFPLETLKRGGEDVEIKVLWWWPESGSIAPIQCRTRRKKRQINHLNIYFPRYHIKIHIPKE
jgi:hypothetical protein